MMTLARLLDGLDVEVEPFRVYDLRRACALDRDSIKTPTVSRTLSGSGVLTLVGGATVRFTTQRVIVLPAPRGAPTPRPSGHFSVAPWATINAADGDPDTLVACGRIRVSYQGSVGLFDHMRDPLEENITADDPLRRSFEELMEEIAALRPGSRSMAETLVRRCLILLLRRHFEHADCELSWLAAIEDARLGRAVTAMQDRPEQSFTLLELAEVAGMSRSVFAARFTGALGQSPIEFLKTLRLARAAQLLVRTDLPVKAVASRVGYASRSSFTRAFLACHGVGPMAFRTSAHEPAGSFGARPATSGGASEVA
jgi:AraC-like DNA-binding protein